jgi:hypothetical protein
MYVVKPLFIIYHLLNAEREREREREGEREREENNRHHSFNLAIKGIISDMGYSETIVMIVFCVSKDTRQLEESRYVGNINII